MLGAIVTLGIALGTAAVEPSADRLVVLEVVWRPSLCSDDYCERNWKENDFAIQSFHAESPSSAEALHDCPCVSPAVNLSENTRSLLLRFGPSAFGPSAVRWERQFRRFACCISQRLTIETYYQQAIELMMQEHPLERLMESGITAGEFVQLAHIQGAFSREISLECREGRLVSLRLYFSPDYKLIDAPRKFHAEDCKEALVLPLLHRDSSL